MSNAVLGPPIFDNLLIWCRSFFQYDYLWLRYSNEISQQSARDFYKNDACSPRYERCVSIKFDCEIDRSQIYKVEVAKFTNILPFNIRENPRKRRDMELNKKTVLPKALLEKVTKNIQQKYNCHGTASSLSESLTSDADTAVRISTGVLGDTNIHRDCEIVLESHKTDSSFSMISDEQSKTTQGFLRFPGKEDTGPDDSGFYCSEKVDPDSPSGTSLKESEHVTTVHSDECTGYEDSMVHCDDLFNDPEAQIERKRQKRLKKKTTEKDDVYNVSSLFDGEFERKYRKSHRYQKKSKQRNKEKKKEQKENVDGDESSVNKSKVKRSRPNYFVAIQISNPQIHKKAKEIQESIVEKNKGMSPAMNPLPTLHLTMSVLNLEDQDAIDRASAALDKFCQLYNAKYGKALELDVTGIGNFGNNVLFAKVAGGEEVDHLQKIADEVEDCLEDFGILSTEKGFKPHITLAKLSRGYRKLKEKGIRKIDVSLYRDYEECHFGRQTVTSLQLCSMMKKKDVNGYYQVAHQVSLGTHDSSCDEGVVMMECEDHHQTDVSDVMTDNTKTDMDTTCDDDSSATTTKVNVHDDDSPATASTLTADDGADSVTAAHDGADTVTAVLDGADSVTAAHCGADTVIVGTQLTTPAQDNLTKSQDIVEWSIKDSIQTLKHLSRTESQNSETAALKADGHMTDTAEGLSNDDSSKVCGVDKELDSVMVIDSEDKVISASVDEETVRNDKE